jgi:hypothetical protein
MLTLFTTPKPFYGHTDVIQRNALKSWTLLHPDVEVIVFGDDAGAAQVCRELGLRHEPNVEREENGPPSVRSIFAGAQEIARHDRVCYCNCDIILTDDFRRALETVRGWREKFLMIGRRWDLDVTAALGFCETQWQEGLREKARREGFQRLYYNVDYFLFTKGLYTDIPALAVGRRWWDNWAVWKANASGAAVVDASEVVMAIHQNHDYGHLPGGRYAVFDGEEALRNLELAGGWSHLHTMEDAKWRLTAKGISPNRFAWLAPAKRRWRRAISAVRNFARTRVWHPFLDKTRTVRHALGLQASVLRPLRRRSTARRHWLDQ